MTPSTEDPRTSIASDAENESMPRWVGTLVRVLLGAVLAVTGWYLSLLGLVFLIFDAGTWCEGAEACTSLRPWAVVPAAAASAVFALCLWMWTPAERRPRRRFYLVGGVGVTILATLLLYLT